MKTILSRNLADVKRRIAAAARRAGRQPDEVTLVAVTKYVDVETVRALHELGIEDFGESRPQELWKKAAAVPEARWHLVGHLQRNKVEDTLPLVTLIHSVDSTRLLKAIEIEARKLNRRADVLLEFNLSRESTKHGFAPNDERGLRDLMNAVAELEKVHVVGLMTMAALAENAQDSRSTFAALRELRTRTIPFFYDMRYVNRSLHRDLRHLSMGMSNDFEVAVEEGATIVRIGSALFHGLDAASSSPKV